MSSILQAPSLSPLTTLFFNALVTHLLPVNLNLDGGESVPCKLGLGPFNPLVFDQPFTLYGHLNGLWRLNLGNLDLLALRQEFREWHEADPAHTFGLLPEGLIRASLERMFLPVLDAISKYTHFPAFFVGKPGGKDEDNFQERLNLCLVSRGKVKFRTPIELAFMDALTVQPLVEFLQAQPNLPLNNDLLASLCLAHLNLKLQLGSLHLKRSELASLSLGDILFPPNLSLNPSVKLSQNLSLACSFQDKTLVVQAIENLQASDWPNASEPVGESPVSQNQPEESGPLLSQEQLNDLELEVCFALPSLKLPLGECAKLTPGYTFTLGQDVEHLPIQVLVGGQAVAKGRLVEVAGSLGVQLTQVLANTLALGDEVKS